MANSSRYGEAMSNTAPFAVDTYRVDGHTIVIESYRDGEVDAHRQRNGSGAYNARKYTRWVAKVDGRVVEDLTSRYGYTKRETYEFTRQEVARTADSALLRDPVTKAVRGRTRPASVVHAEMRSALVKHEVNA